MNIGIGFQEDHLGLLGQQVTLALNAYKQPGEMFPCAVRQEAFKGEDLLVVNEGSPRRFLVFDSLPGNLEVKAIGIDKTQIFIELTAYDTDKIARVSPAHGVRFRDSALWIGPRRVASLLFGTQSESDEAPRMLCTINHEKLASLGLLDQVVRAIDEFDNNDVYVEADAPSVGSGSIEGVRPVGVRLEQRLDLQVRLIQTQQPILALGVEDRMGQVQRLELTQMLRFERLLEQNPEETILQALKRDASPVGQQRLARFIEFAMARRVRKAALSVGLDLSWRDARKAVRKLGQQHTARP